jgi:DNA invertase Pin-like site-specific DNA recombinase
MRNEHLDDQQFDRLVSAVVAEQKRRGKKLSISDQRVAVPLTQGKVNAVRAAFKAGITPSRIARQFGISQANVRKALAGDPPK